MSSRFSQYEYLTGLKLGYLQEANMSFSGGNTHSVPEVGAIAAVLKLKSQAVRLHFHNSVVNLNVRCRSNESLQP